MKELGEVHPGGADRGIEEGPEGGEQDQEQRYGGDQRIEGQGAGQEGNVGLIGRLEDPAGKAAE